MPAASTAPEGAAAPGETPHHETSVTWRVIPVDRAPEAGRDYKVIRTSQEWAALFEGTGAAPPEISFEGQMVVLLRFRLAGDVTTPTLKPAMMTVPGPPCRRSLAGPVLVDEAADLASELLLLGPLTKEAAMRRRFASLRVTSEPVLVDSTAEPGR